MNESLSMEWKRLIDPKLGAHRFFTDSRSTWGNQRWIGRRMFVVIFTVSVIVVGLRIRFDFTADLDQEVYGEIPYLVFLAVPFFALTAILCLLPRFDDNVFIATEMRSVIGVLLFILVAFGAQEFVEHQNEDDDDAKNVGIAVNVIYYAVIESSNTICILIATAFVMKKVEPLLTDQIMRRSQYLGA